MGCFVLGGLFSRPSSGRLENTSSGADAGSFSTICKIIGRRRRPIQSKSPEARGRAAPVAGGTAEGYTGAAAMHYPRRISKIKRVRNLGFRARMKTKRGRKLLNRKRRRGRALTNV